MGRRRQREGPHPARNAIRHGLRSDRHLLDGEDPNEFNVLQSEMIAALAPVGALELSLAERIVLAIWRQRRLSRAETAAIALERRPADLVDGLRMRTPYGERDGISKDCLEPFDEELAAWCRSVFEEGLAFEGQTLTELQNHAPKVWAHLAECAEEDRETPAEYISGFSNGLGEYLSSLSDWCRQQLRAADKRPEQLRIVEHLREQRLVLPLKQLEVFARYQTTLDNQLYKALRAFREAQEWRLKSLDHDGGPVDQQAQGVAA